MQNVSLHHTLTKYWNLLGSCSHPFLTLNKAKFRAYGVLITKLHRHRSTLCYTTTNSHTNLTNSKSCESYCTHPFTDHGQLLQARKEATTSLVYCVNLKSKKLQIFAHSVTGGNRSILYSCYLTTILKLFPKTLLHTVKLSLGTGMLFTAKSARLIDFLYSHVYFYATELSQ